MEKKTDKVRNLVARGNYKAALKIAKDFRLGIDKETSDDMRRGYECMNYPQFYRSIGMDTDAIIQKGIETIIRLYGPERKEEVAGG